MRVALFATCLGDLFFADAVADAVRLLRSLDVEVSFPPDQTCCGQPAFNAGYWDEARAMARHTVDAFRDADAVVLPSGSCATMLRRHYAELLDDTDAALDLAQRTYELAEYVAGVVGEAGLGRGLEGRRIAYHHGCHGLRELGLGPDAERLLRGAGAELVPWEAAEECCGFGGLFAVKLPHVSAAMADRKIDTLPPADVLTSADGGCLLHLSGRMEERGGGLEVRHLASLLWEARSGARVG